MEESPGECKYNTWRWVNTITGETRPFKCGSWDCPECSSALAWRVAFRIAAGSPERLITLTGVPLPRKRAYGAFQALARSIRREGWAFEYLRVVEAGELHGALHWHVAQVGDFIPHRWLTKTCESVGLGQVNDIRRCYGRGPHWYLVKTGLEAYMSKAAMPIPPG